MVLKLRYNLAPIVPVYYQTMMIWVSILIFSCIGQTESKNRRACAAEDLCMPVPPEICDSSKCIPFKLEDFNAIGAAGTKAYTWNIGQASYDEGYCPLKFNLVATQYENGNAGIPITLFISRGRHCNESYTIFRPFLAEPDPYTGLYTTFSVYEAGNKYETCFNYFEPGEAFVFRFCQVEPPLPKGKSCATIYVYEAACGNPNRDKLNAFLKEYAVDFQQHDSDCVNVYPNNEYT